MRSNRVRLCCYAIVLSGFGMAIAAPWPGLVALASGRAQDQGRKTTDPPVAARGKLGQELFLAIDHRDVASVRSLIKSGADPNSRNGLEFTPLDVAAASHQLDVMKDLIAAGAKPDAGSPYGTALMFAAATAHIEGADLLLDRGVPVNTTRGDGNTPLMMAANAGFPPLVADLLKRNANVNATNVCDSTPLLFAARQGNLDAGRILLEAGATVDAANEDGLTPLMAAAMTGHADFVRMLLQHGAKPDAVDGKNRTALLLAASYGDYPDVVKTLIDGGANAKATDMKGRTAAILAARRGYSGAAVVLSAPSVAPERANPRDAISRSLRLLQASTAEFERNANCISCHQEGLARMAFATARDHGFALDAELQKSQIQRIRGVLGFMRPLHTQALTSPAAMKQVPLIEINEVNTMDSWILAGMAAQKDAPDDGAAAMAMVLARQQLPDGHWSFSLPRVPMQSSFFTFTALAARSLSTYAPKSSSREVADRLAKGRAWLMHAQAKTSDDLAFRLLGLNWTGATMAQRRQAIAELLAAQHPDGGWSQLPNLHSDAYATGQAIYALRTAGGYSSGAAAIRRGTEFLLRTQEDDGSWFVNKRAMPANNYFDAGFPYGESQYASFNGTCWAMMALLENLPR